MARTRTEARPTGAAEAQLHVALDNMPGALVYTDDDLDVVFCNARFREMYPAPPELLRPGRPYPDFLRWLASNGYYGPGDVEALVARRVESLRNPTGQGFEDRTPDGRVYLIRRRRVAAGGVVTVMTDITEQKDAEREVAAKEARFHVALDNMPGALVYTDDALNIVFCNDRFREMYPAPPELLQPGRPYPEFLRWLATNGYYGAGDVDEMVARRIDSLRNPSGRTFEDRTPNGRVYRIRRRQVAAGGVVTVMTDVTEQKQVELGLLDEKRRTEEASLQLAEKNGMLETLSSKLAKYLSPQVYRSIFSGAQNVEIASKRKKLTVFFSDIAAFTETTDNLESEELTDVLNHYLTRCRGSRSSTARPSTNSSATRCCCSSATPRRAASRRTPRPAWRWRSPCSGACASSSRNGCRAASSGRSASAWGSAPVSARWAISAARTAWTTRSSATR